MIYQAFVIALIAFSVADARAPAFDGAPRRCNDYTYKTGKCTTCPGQWNQECQRVTDKVYGVMTTMTGGANGNSYCGVLGCEVNCRVFIWDFGCGCNKGMPRNGRCINPRRRAEASLGSASQALEEMPQSEMMDLEAEESGGSQPAAETMPVAPVADPVDKAMLAKERSLNNFPDMQMFCNFAKQEKVCDDQCEGVTNDKVFEMFLPVHVQDPCHGETRISAICPVACAEEADGGSSLTSYLY